MCRSFCLQYCIESEVQHPTNNKPRAKQEILVVDMSMTDDFSCILKARVLAPCPVKHFLTKLNRCRLETLHCGIHMEYRRPRLPLLWCLERCDLLLYDIAVDLCTSSTDWYIRVYLRPGFYTMWARQPCMHSVAHSKKCRQRWEFTHFNLAYA